MKKENVETKNGGTISVTIYENLEEYIQENSKATALKNLNRITRVDAVNEANRTQSQMAKVKRAVKAGKISEASLDALLKKLLAESEKAKAVPVVKK